MNTRDFIRLGIPPGEDTRRATDFVSQFILSGGDRTKLADAVAVDVGVIQDRGVAVIQCNAAWAPAFTAVIPPQPCRCCGRHAGRNFL